MKKNLPATAGGRPVRNKPLAFYKPTIGALEKKAVCSVLDSGWITAGPAVKRFEQAIQEQTGARHVLAVNSCTQGLAVSLDALGIQKGDEVITTPLTFASTVHVIEHCGAVPRFADVDPATLNLDPERVKSLIGRKTKAILPVHLAGQPADLKAFRSLAREKGLHLIEDAAHAFGANYAGTPIGASSEAAVFSFHAVKNLTTAEGGAIAMRSSQVARRAQTLINNGLNRDAWGRYRDDGWRYRVTACGYKANMSDVHAAIGLGQLQRFEKFQKRRRVIVSQYERELSQIPGLIIPREVPGTVHAWHVYLMRLDRSRFRIGRDRFMRALREEGIHCNVHYIPVHLQPYYREHYGSARGDCPVAETAAAGVITLPLYPAMTSQDTKDVVTAVRKVAQYYAR